jgi:segregation and condensation protein B
VVEKFVLDGQQARLTQAALETLAVVAYKQPVSRAGSRPCAGSTSTA